MNLKPARIVLCLGLMVSAPIGVSTAVYAQDADPAVAEYVGVLNQIQNIKVATAQRRLMLANQEAEIAAMRSEIEIAPQTRSAVRGIVTEMVAEMEKVIESDLPFRRDERYARLDRLRRLLGDEATLDSELFRSAMSLYDIEGNYGYTISAYTGDNPKTPGRRLEACRADAASSICNLSKDQSSELAAGLTLDDIADTIKDGNYVHFGRLSFIYLDLDSREGYRWSKDANDWEALSSSDILNARRSVRIARGESAPGVVTAPIKMQAAQ